MSETITIYCKNNNTYKDVPIGSSLQADERASE